MIGDPGAPSSGPVPEVSADDPAVPVGAWRDLDSSVCSVARVMAVLGEPWTVLVVRDLLRSLLG